MRLTVKPGSPGDPCGPLKNSLIVSFRNISIKLLTLQEQDSVLVGVL